MLFVGGYYGVSLVSRGIKIATWGDVSHVSLIKESGATIQSWHKGGVALGTNPWDLHTPDTRIQLFRIDCPEELENVIWNRALDEVGSKYDFSALLGFVPGLRAWHKNKTNRWFCSELISYVCESSSFRLFNTTVPHYKIDPTYLCSSPALTPVGYVRSVEAFHKLIGRVTRNR